MDSSRIHPCDSRFWIRNASAYLPGNWNSMSSWQWDSEIVCSLFISNISFGNAYAICQSPEGELISRLFNNWEKEEIGNGDDALIVRGKENGENCERFGGGLDSLDWHRTQSTYTFLMHAMSYVNAGNVCSTPSTLCEIVVVTILSDSPASMQTATISNVMEAAAECWGFHSSYSAVGSWDFFSSWSWVVTIHASSHLQRRTHAGHAVSHTSMFTVNKSISTSLLQPSFGSQRMEDSVCLPASSHTLQVSSRLFCLLLFHFISNSNRRICAQSHHHHHFFLILPLSHFITHSICN